MEADSTVAIAEREEVTGLVNLRKILSPQRDVLALLAKRGDWLISERVAVYFRDVYDHTLRLHESVESRLGRGESVAAASSHAVCSLLRQQACASGFFADVAPKEVEMATQQLRRAPGSSGLYDVLELILDRGLVVDAYVRVSLVGIELLTVDLRVVVASVDTYLRYAEAMERLGWHERERSPSMGLPDMVSDGMTRHAVQRGSERVTNALTGQQRNSGHGNGHGNGHGMTGALASGAHTVAEATGSALARGAEKLKHTFSAEEEGERGASGRERSPQTEREELSARQGQDDQQQVDQEDSNQQQAESAQHGQDDSRDQDNAGEHQ